MLYINRKQIADSFVMQLLFSVDARLSSQSALLVLVDELGTLESASNLVRSWF